jgi:hypothetical protein
VATARASRLGHENAGSDVKLVLWRRLQSPPTARSRNAYLTTNSWIASMDKLGKVTVQAKEAAKLVDLEMHRAVRRIAKA